RRRPAPLSGPWSTCRCSPRGTHTWRSAIRRRSCSSHPTALATGRHRPSASYRGPAWWVGSAIRRRWDYRHYHRRSHLRRHPVRNREDRPSVHSHPLRGFVHHASLAGLRDDVLEELLALMCNDVLRHDELAGVDVGVDVIRLLAARRRHAGGDGAARLEVLDETTLRVVAAVVRVVAGRGVIVSRQGAVVDAAPAIGIITTPIWVQNARVRLRSAATAATAHTGAVGVAGVASRHVHPPRRTGITD